MLDRFYLIADAAHWLARLLPCGVKLVQLRVKDKSEDEIAREIVEAKRLCAEYGAQLIVNDYWQAAIDAGCDYVHLGQEDLAAADVYAIKRAGLKLGISTHTHAELEVALRAKPDYVALGPIYPTILKEMRFAPQGLAHDRRMEAPRRRAAARRDRRHYFGACAGRARGGRGFHCCRDGRLAESRSGRACAGVCRDDA